MKKIVLFGMGGISRLLTEHLKKNVEIIGYCASEYTPPPTHKGKYPYKIIGLKELGNCAYDFILVAFSDFEKGRKILLEHGVSEQKIVGYDIEAEALYTHLSEHFHDTAHDTLIPELFNIPRKSYYPCSMNLPEADGIVELDYVREQTLALVAKEIKKKNISGNMAELGVYKGDFAKKMNALLPDRKLYLFDTFTGFDDRDWNASQENHFGEIPEPFAATQLSEVLDKMPARGNCIVKQGFFPETFDIEQEQFCLVSLDCDLYQPTCSGLKLFYPRMVKGGYILIHDYNNIVFNGVRKAVNEFCGTNGITYVPIPDKCGTIIIAK